MPTLFFLVRLFLERPRMQYSSYNRMDMTTHILGVLNIPSSKYYLLLVLFSLLVWACRPPYVWLDSCLICT